MVDNPFGTSAPDYTNPSDNPVPPVEIPEESGEGGGESESPADEDKAEAPKVEAEAEALVEDRATRPESHLNAMIRILGDYNNRETDIPLTHEYWEHRNKNTQR